MNTNKFIKLTLATVAICTMGAISPLLADDIEVYVSPNLNNTVRPNIVFIIDTSGSMDNTVTMVTGSYDPNVTYTGTCTSDKVYWSSNGNPPSCGTSNYFNKTSLTCNDADTPLFGTSGSGFYVGRLARYRTSKNQWRSFSNNDHSSLVECQADFGVHGETAASTDLYPADGGPWQASSTGAIAWAGTGSTYTLYSANYMNFLTAPGSTTTKTRLQIVQEVFSELMDSISNVNIAVMRYSQNGSGGYFSMPMQQLTAANRQSYKDSVNAFTAQGDTPLAETMYEAYLFYSGAAVDYGDSSTPSTNVAGVLDPSDTTKYKSPIGYQCQKNFVILLTDGAPNGDYEADTSITALPNFSSVTGSTTCSGNCLDELTKVMYQNDCNASLLTTQNVITYTIGFTTNQTLLSSAASNGGGSYYTADDTAGLTNAFTSIITDILAINTTFTAPAVSVNAFNRSYHNEELYYALFRPNARPKWTGNIKRYKFWDGGTSGDPVAVRDVNNAIAVDPNTGFTYASSKSWWTLAADAPDGDLVGKGGAAGMLSTTRNTYTYTGSNSNLTHATNALSASNAAPSGAITKTMMGNASMTDTELTNYLSWIHGTDIQDDNSDGVFTDARRFIADPLHAQPVLITYGGTTNAPDTTLFAATNEGYLHAINTSDGTEYFAFMPQELLPNIATLYTDSSAVNHVYGLDGPLTYWFNDANDNGKLYDTTPTLDTDEFLYLYQGMRRGGNSYYALNVTDRSTPLFKWKITGGAGGTTGFVELAQTWSSMTKGKIKFNSTDRDVLIFGGGYDTAQDGNSLAADDSVGRAIYMVDADTGAKIWEAGPSTSADTVNLTVDDMTNSIPSDVKVMDTDGDGYSDRMYVGDMRGQIWRFDIDNAGDFSSADSLVTGGVIARLGGSTAADNRRFYYTPQVVLSQDRSYYAIVIGSGYRAHPTDTAIHDAFFMIRDTNLSPISSYLYVDSDNDGTNDSVITLSSLYDATLNIIGNTSTTANQRKTENTTLAGKHGWYFWLNEGNPADSTTFIGEKVTDTALVLNNTIMFSTFTPVAAASASCAPSQGRGLQFEVNLRDATPTYDYNGDGEYSRADRIAQEIVGGSLPPKPVDIFTPDCPSGIAICVGMTCKCSELKRTPKKERWSQQ